MTLKKPEIELLRSILENLHNPEMLDTHPWVSCLFVKDAVARNNALQNVGPGEQLIGALIEVFAETMPGMPPRRGKRLDNHWGEFGILAAQFFVPLQFGTPAPDSLREAWCRIDQAILLFVFGKDGDSRSSDAIEAYKLVGDEPEVAPISTLSDWQRKGIQRLLDAVDTREQYLDRSPQFQSLSSAISSDQPLPAAFHHQSINKRPLKKGILFSLVLLVFALLVFGGYKARKIYGLARVLEQDASELRELIASSPNMQGINNAGPVLVTLRQDFDGLKGEVEPFLWLGPWLGWIPEYGGDLASSREVLELADLLLQSGETSYVAFQPLLSLLDRDEEVDPPRLVELLEQARPQLMQANHFLEQAAQVRTGIDADRLSPRMQELMDDLDRAIPVMDDGLKVTLALPDFLGASSSGPRTYLLLVQNEDELRPTGGFITAVGTLVIKDGQILKVTFIDSGELDNWDYPYPISPWQLEQYMNSPVLVLRDSNWFVDFPTSALYAETLFAYNYSHSVDGVIAFDQHMLVLILQALGPIELQGINEQVDAGNVITFMRSAKSPPVGEPVPDGWSRKAFMDQITEAILTRIFESGDVPWDELGDMLLQGLEQRHLLLQLDDASLSKVMAARGWNGALNTGPGDYLRVVDANVGFNKTSAFVDTSIAYDVDLTDLTRPLGHLTIIHRNHSSSNVECIQWGARRAEGEDDYPVNACYWNYMRIYKPAGTQLLDAAPQVIPDEWMILDRGVDGQVDVLEEEVKGLQAFGTLMVIPGSDSIVTEFQFGLPKWILVSTPDTDQVSYHLKIDKQPGTIAIPLTLRIHVPNGSVIESVPQGAIVEGNNLLFETDLSMDIALEIVFSVK
jgi:hypothetical protein